MVLEDTPPSPLAREAIWNKVTAVAPLVQGNLRGGEAETRVPAPLSSTRR